MGYTHYWSLKTKPTDKTWGAFLAEVSDILAHPIVASKVCFEEDEPNRPPQIDKHIVRFNGKGDDGHETLVLERDVTDFSSCKTGGMAQADLVDQWGKSYDLAVCAVLLAGVKHLKLSISSDGDWSEPSWQAARALYGRVTSSIPRCPWKEKQCTECLRSFKVKGHRWGDRSQACTKCERSSYTCFDGKTKICMNCHGTKWKWVGKPITWCWWCSNGYKTKADASKAIETTLDAVLVAIEKAAKDKGLETRK